MYCCPFIYVNREVSLIGAESVIVRGDDVSLLPPPVNLPSPPVVSLVYDALAPGNSLVLLDEFPSGSAGTVLFCPPCVKVPLELN